MALTQTQLEKVEKYIELYDSSIIYNDNTDFLIEESADSLSESFFGHYYCKAVALLTLHEFAMVSRASDGQAGNGTLISKTIGPVTVKFSAPGKDGTQFSTTMYGKMLEDLIRFCGGPTISVTGVWRRIN